MPRKPKIKKPGFVVREISLDELNRVLKENAKKRSRIASERNVKRWANVSVDERSRIGREHWEKIPAEERSRIARERWEKVSSEDRSRSGRKAWEKIPADERSRIVRERWAKVSAEKRSRIARERWEKVSGFAELRYIENLPVLNLLGKKEIDGYLNRFLSEFSSEYVRTDKADLKVHGWKNYKPHWRNDVTQEFVVAILDALRKWDKKSGLRELVSDSIVFHLINFFRENKRYRSALRDISPELAELMRERKKG